MTPKEYLMQAYRLENEIKIEKEKLETMRSLLTSITSPGYEEHYNPNRGTDAPYVQLLEKAFDIEEKIATKLTRLLELRTDIENAIDRNENKDERLVLIYRYLNHMSWSEIADEMYADKSSVRRWHDRALSRFLIPTA